jgi:hypothetical protein
MRPFWMHNLAEIGISFNVRGGGNTAADKEKIMDFASLCLFLGVLFAFGTLLLKVIEVARGK